MTSLPASAILSVVLDGDETALDPIASLHLVSFLAAALVVLVAVTPEDLAGIAKDPAEAARLGHLLGEVDDVWIARLAAGIAESVPADTATPRADYPATTLGYETDGHVAASAAALAELLAETELAIDSGNSALELRACPVSFLPYKQVR